MKKRTYITTINRILILFILFLLESVISLPWLTVFIFLTYFHEEKLNSTRLIILVFFASLIAVTNVLSISLVLLLLMISVFFIDTPSQLLGNKLFIGTVFTTVLGFLSKHQFNKYSLIFWFLSVAIYLLVIQSNLIKKWSKKDKYQVNQSWLDYLNK